VRPKCPPFCGPNAHAYILFRIVLLTNTKPGTRHDELEPTRCARNVKKARVGCMYTQPMRLNQIRWGLAVGGALAAELVLIVAAFAWVTIYSHLLHPGESLAFYQQYALMAGPWVSMVMGIPVFYLASRWFARTWPTAMGLFGIYLLTDVALLTLLAGDNPNLVPWRVVVSYLLKFLACCLGGRGATKNEAAQLA